MNQPIQIIDGDGHIFEDGDGIARHFPFSAAGGRLRSGVFPLNSHIQYSLTRRPPGAFATTADGRFENPGPEGWVHFMDEVGISHAVLFPTAGQRIGSVLPGMFVMVISVPAQYQGGAPHGRNSESPSALLPHGGPTLRPLMGA